MLAGHGTPAARPVVAAGPRVLIVEDNAAERDRLVAALKPLDCDVEACGSAREAIQAIARAAPSLVVLDLNLPDAHGREVLASLRRASGAPVLVHSARSGERDKVTMLDAGADDFVVKPVGAAEFRSRVQAHLRRAAFYESLAGEPVRVGGLVIDLAREKVSRGGAAVALTPTEWGVLRALTLQAGRTLTHAELWRQVWGARHGDAQAHLRVHITHLRRKLERTPATPTLIVTDPGVGYRLELA